MIVYNTQYILLQTIIRLIHVGNFIHTGLRVLYAVNYSVSKPAPPPPLRAPGRSNPQYLITWYLRKCLSSGAEGDFFFFSFYFSPLSSNAKPVSSRHWLGPVGWNALHDPIRSKVLPIKEKGLSIFDRCLNSSLRNRHMYDIDKVSAPVFFFVFFVFFVFFRFVKRMMEAPVS